MKVLEQTNITEKKFQITRENIHILELDGILTFFTIMRNGPEEHEEEEVEEEEEEKEEEVRITTTKQ